MSCTHKLSVLVGLACFVGITFICFEYPLSHSNTNLAFFEIPKEDIQPNMQFRRRVYTTLIAKENGYIAGATMLGASLLATNTTADLVLLSTTALSNTAIEELQVVGGWHIRFVQPIDSPFPKNCAIYCDTYNKLRVWQELVDYDIAVFLDADTIVAKNIDELFELDVREDQIAAVQDPIIWTLNSGVVVFKPSLHTFNNFLKQMGKIEQPFHRTGNPFEYAEQTFFLAYFHGCALDDPACSHSRNNMTLIASRYNCQLGNVNMREMQPHDVAVYHFTWIPKPWSCPNAPCCDDEASKAPWIRRIGEAPCESMAFRRGHEMWYHTWKDVQTMKNGGNVLSLL